MIDTPATFTFDSYHFDRSTGQISLKYSFDNSIKFEEVVTIPVNDSVEYDEPKLDRALFALHLIAGISYYKAYIPKNIEVRSGSLSEVQAEFWNTVYTKGMGEFFYRNDIDFRGLVQFPYGRVDEIVNKVEVKGKDKDKVNALVPIGGGKDSIVTIETLKKLGVDVTLFRVGQHPLIEKQAEIAGCPLLNIKRQISPTLFELNEQGALNGHIPITAYNSFVAIVTAILHGYDAIIFSNERSANIGNTEMYDMEVNHQWSKSLECEEMIQSYIQQYISSNLDYYSLLRPHSELAITKEFVEYPQYLHHSTSCNANWRILKEKPDELWGTDSKSVFVFALYAAFLEKETIVDIFKRNLFDDPDVLDTYRELMGLQGIKPFECVGTPDETKAAFLLAHERGEWESSIAMKMFTEEVLPTIKDPGELITDIMEPLKSTIFDSKFTHFRRDT